MDGSHIKTIAETISWLAAKRPGNRVRAIYSIWMEVGLEIGKLMRKEKQNE